MDNSLNRQYKHTDHKHSKIHRYTVLDFPIQNKTFGIYKSKTPSRAASKAFTKIIKHLNKNISNESKQFLVFHIQNLDTNKIYQYAGTRVKLANPIVVRRSDGSDMKFNYKNFIVKHKNLHI
jgi:hypothetical protein